MLKPATTDAITSDLAGAGIDPATIAAILQVIQAVLPLILALLQPKPAPTPTPAP
jgi:hypothetical protein